MAEKTGLFVFPFVGNKGHFLLYLSMCVYAFIKVTISYNLDFYLPHNSKRINKKKC